MSRPAKSHAAQSPASARQKWCPVVPGLVVGLAAALHHLLRPALWYDEASSLGAIRDLTGSARQSGATMATYYLVLRVWATVSTDPVWLRTLSLLASLAALALTVRLATRWMGVQWATWTGVFLGLSYLWGDQAAEARSYAFVLLLTVASWAVLDRLIAASDDTAVARRAGFAYATLWLVLPPTHGLAVLILGAQVATLLTSRAGATVWRRVSPGVGIGLTATAALWVAGAKGVTNWVPPSTFSGVGRLVQTSTGTTPEVALLMCVAIALGVALRLSLYRSAMTPVERYRSIAPVAWGLLPFLGLVVLSVRTPLLVPRYLVGAAPGVAMLLAAGVEHATALVAAPRRRLAQVAGIGVVISGLLTAQASIHVQAADRWDHAADLVADQAREGDALLFPERRNRIPFEAATRLGAPVQPDLLDFPRPLGAVRYSEPERSRPETLAALAGHDRLWVVYEHVFPASTVALNRLERSDELRNEFRLAQTWKIDNGIEVRLYLPR